MKIEEIEIGKLKKSVYNPRIMNEKEMNDLVNSIREFGFVEPLVINGDYQIIGGHQRFEAGQKLGYKKYPCIIIKGLGDVKEKLLNIALNKIHGEWDIPKLFNIMEELKIKTDISIELSGFNTEEINRIFKNLPQMSIKEKEYDENIETENKCPKCGYEW